MGHGWVEEATGMEERSRPPLAGELYHRPRLAPFQPRMRTSSAIAACVS